MGVLDARRRRLVYHPAHVEARAAERFERDESLVAVRVGRNGNRGLQLLVALDAQVGAGEQIAPQRRQIASQQFQRRQPMIADLDALVRPDRPEAAFERAQNAPALRAMFLRRVEAEDYLAAARGGHRRIPFERVPVFGMEANDGIVAAVYRRDHRSRRSKIDSKKHNDLSQQSGGFAPTLVFTGYWQDWGGCYDLPKPPRSKGSAA